MTYPKWLKIKLWKRLLNQSNLAGKPMSETTQKAAIAKLRKLVRTGQSQEKILLEAINGIYRGLEETAKEKNNPKLVKKVTKQPLLPNKSKNVVVINNNLSKMRETLR